MNALVPAVSPMKRAEIEQYGNDYLQRWHPGLLTEPGKLDIIDCFERLYDDYDLNPGVKSLSLGVEGIAWPDGRIDISEETYRGALRGDGRCRFTIMHEVFHALRHIRQIRRALVDTHKLTLHRRENIPAYRNPEWQADWFAGAVLMPAEMVKRLVSNTDCVEMAKKLMSTFSVSRTAAGVRIRVLGIC